MATLEASAEAKPRIQKVVTFYSFEGGTGRTLMCANVAALLANNGNRVLMVDFNTESPGLQYLKELAPKQGEPTRGISGFIADSWNARHVQDVTRYLRDIAPEHWQGEDILVLGDSSSHATLRQGRLAFMDAFGGTQETLRHDHATTEEFLSASVDGKDPHKTESLLSFLFDLRKQWFRDFDFVLLDSSSGFTNNAGISTRLLADHVVLLTRFGGKGIPGTRQVLDQIGDRSLYDFPLATTVVLSKADGSQSSDEICKRLGIQGEDSQTALIRMPFHPQLQIEDIPFLIHRGWSAAEPVISSYAEVTRQVMRPSLTTQIPAA